MKRTAYLAIAFVVIMSSFRPRPAEEVEFVCMKTHKATNTCHFNFRIDGANYRFVDVGCKYQKKQGELVKKVQEGEIFLAREWKVACPEPKPAE